MSISLSRSTANKIRSLLGNRAALNTGGQEGTFLSPELDYIKLWQYPSGTIIDATNDSPIVVETSPAHGRVTGESVVIEEVQGNTAATGTWTITVTDSTHFELDGSTGDGDYTSGGTWKLLVDPISGYGTIVDATNASPIVIETTGGHGRATGDVMIIGGVVGNANANGQHTITVIDSTHFSLNGSTGSGAYTSGGSYYLIVDPTITDATNASPIVIETAGNHNKITGDSVEITGVLGNDAANGGWVITVIDETHFSLDGSTGDGAYTSGGIFRLLFDGYVGNIVKYDTNINDWIEFAACLIVEINSEPLTDGQVYLAMRAGADASDNAIYITRKFIDEGLNAVVEYSASQEGITNVGDGITPQWAKGPKGFIHPVYVRPVDVSGQLTIAGGEIGNPGQIRYSYLDGGGEETGTPFLAFLFPDGGGFTNSIVLVNGVYGVFQGGGGGSYSWGVENETDVIGNTFKGGINVSAATGAWTLSGGTW